MPGTEILLSFEVVSAMILPSRPSPSKNLHRLVANISGHKCLNTKFKNVQGYILVQLRSLYVHISYLLKIYYCKYNNY
jgi:hypothetical protein